MRILGTTTSPYTRKVLIVARAAGLEAPLIDTRSPEGAEELRLCAPLEKVPVAVLDDEPRVLPDSGLIVSYLWSKYETRLRAAGLELGPERWQDRALQVVVEGTMDAAINRFYLVGGGVGDEGYVAKQRVRVERCVDWLARELRFERPITAPVLSFGCFLEWAAFRSVLDVAAVPAVARFVDAWRDSRLGEGTEPR